MSKIIVGVLVVVLGAAGGVGAYIYIQFQSLSHSPEETAKFLPVETSLYASMNLRPGVGQLTKLRDILDLFKENPKFEEKLDELYGDLEKETGIDVEEELFPWVGPEIALAIPTFEGIEETPDIVAFIGHTDKGAAESFLRKLLAYGEESGETEYEETLTRGRLIFVVDPLDDVSVHIALADDYIVVATGSGMLAQTLDRMDSGQAQISLFDDAGFQEAREAAESPRFGLMYIDVAGIIDQAGEEALGEEIVESVQDFSDQLPDFIVASASFIDNGILVSTSFDYPVEEELFVPAVANSLGSTRLASEDTVGLLSFVGVQDGWESLREELADLPDLDLEEAFDEIEAEIGIDIERDVLGWMTGEMAFAVLLPGGVSFNTDEIHANAYVEFDDRDKALFGIERIRAALEDGGVDFDVVDIEGNEAVVADVGDDLGTPNLLPGYVVLDDYVVIGTTLASLRQAVLAEKGDISSLRESSAFNRPLGAVGDSTDLVAFGNIRRIVQEALDQLDETEFEEYVETADPFLAPLEGFLLGAAVDESLVTVSAVITFAAPTDAPVRNVADAPAFTSTERPAPSIQTAKPEPAMAPPVPTAAPPDRAECTRTVDALSGLVFDEPTQGNLDYEGEVDCFTFEGEAGQVYQIDVALGTLDDSVAELLDSDGWEVAYNDDYGDTLGSRIVWEAPDSGDYYVEVSGFGGTGSYTLTVSLTDITDDHGDDTGGATAVEVGEDTEGILDYEGDTDFFRFSAEAGQLYRIDVALGTLDDSVAELLDSDGWEVAYNDDYGGTLGSLIVWEAPDSSDYYVEVSGFGGTGSYTLTVSFTDITDDHGNDTDTATVVEVGEDIEGTLDYVGDTDFFRFSGEAGQVYQIDVALGTLDDSVAELLDSDGWEVAYNDDYGDTLGSLIVWEAPDSGDYYVRVSGWGGTGSYTVTVRQQ